MAAHDANSNHFLYEPITIDASRFAKLLEQVASGKQLLEELMQRLDKKDPA